jgi:hypothetical protein
MMDKFDNAILTLAHELSDEKRLNLIAKMIAMDTPQGRRLAEYAMAIHLHERKQARDAVSWALGTFH